MKQRPAPSRRTSRTSNSAALAGSGSPLTFQLKAGQEIITALEHAPFTRRHGLFLAALLAALVFDYQKPATISFVIPGMREMWGLSETSASYLPVAGMTGTMLGSTFWGFMGDRIGRRTTLLWTVGIFSVASLCGLAMDYWQSVLACFLMGTGVGGEVPIVFALAAEYIPARLRGRTILFLGVVGSVGGYALAAGTAAAVKVFYPEVFAWRLLWLVAVIPGALILVLRSRVVPESARHLLAQGRVEEARAAAESMVGPIPEVSPVEETGDEQPVIAAPVRALYGRTVLLGFFSFALGLASFGFITWLPTLLGKVGYAGATSSAYLALSAFISLPALAITTLLFTRWSTRGTLVSYAVAGGLTFVLLGAAATGGLLTPLVLVAVSSLALFFITSIGGAFPLYSAEVYPTGMRTRRTGIISAAGRLGSIIGPYFGGLWLAGGGSVLGLTILLAIGLIAAAAALHVAGVETRGRSLEQISGS